ncbi:unnamed protein product [Sphagnum troendelagicum]|uniref:Uncharacterized protein n=1 Tax=Sphagnum troendelagicum TaxID=128251 RepID=A0ABP0UKA9_9BRYO
MWKQSQPSSAVAACSSFSSLPGTGTSTDEYGASYVSHCDNSKTTSAFCSFSLLHDIKTCSVGCQASAQLRINPVARKTLHLRSFTSRLNHDNATVEDRRSCFSSSTLAHVSGACSSSSHCRRCSTTTGSWKMCSSEPAAAHVRNNFILQPGTVIRLNRVTSSRCLTTSRESGQIDDMQTDSRSLVDFSSNSSGRDACNAPTTTRTVQNTHFMNYWSQPKKRKLVQHSLSFRSHLQLQESALQLGIGFRAAGGSSPAVHECLSSACKQALDQFNYYSSLLTPDQGSQKNSAASDLTSEQQEQQQLHMASDQDQGSRSSSVDEVAGPPALDDPGPSRCSRPVPAPDKKPRLQQFDPVLQHEPQEEELVSSAHESLRSQEVPGCVKKAYTGPGVPPGNTLNAASQQLELEDRTRSPKSPKEREFYPQATVPLAFETRVVEKKISNLQESSIYQLHHTQQGLPSRPQSDTNVNEEEQEAGTSWLQLRLGTTLKADLGRSGEATLVQEPGAVTSRSFTYPEVTKSPILVLLSSDPTGTIGGTRPAPLNPPSTDTSRLDPAYSRAHELLQPVSPSFDQPLQDRGQLQAAPAILFPQGAAVASRTSRQQVHGASVCPRLHHGEGMVLPLRHDHPAAPGAQQVLQFLRDSTAHQIPVNSTARFPFPAERGDARQPPAGTARQMTSWKAGEGPSQRPRVDAAHELLRPPTSSSPSQRPAPPRFQSEESFLASWMMMGPEGAAAGPSIDSFGRPRSSDHHRPAGLVSLDRQSSFRLPAAWLHEIPPSTSARAGVLQDWRGVISNKAAALQSVNQRGHSIQGPWDRLLDRVGPPNMLQFPGLDRPSSLQQPAPSATAVGSQDIHMASHVRPASQFHNWTSTSGLPASLQPWTTSSWLEAEGIGARGAAAAAASSTSSRQQQSPADPQMQQIRSRTTVIHDHLPDPSGGSRSRAAAGEGLLPSVEAGSAERDLLVGLRSTSARIRPRTPHRYHPAGLWFRLEAASHQHGFPTLDQVPKAYLHVKDENVTVSVVRKYLVERLALENESEVEIACNGLTLQPMLSLQYVRENIWQQRIETSSIHQIPSSSSVPDGRVHIEDPNDSTLSLEDVIMVLHYSKTHQA